MAVIAADCEFFPLLGQSDTWQCRRCATIEVAQLPSRRNCYVFPSVTDRRFPGPGNFLHGSLQRLFGEGITAGCGCADKIAEMNDQGPAGVREQIESHTDYLCGKADEQEWWKEPTAEQGKRRLRWWKSFASLPGRRQAVKLLILHAVRQAEAAIRDNLHDYFDRVVVLCPKKRQEHYERFTAELAAKGWPFKTPERYEGFDGDRVPVPSWWPHSAGHWGATNAHIRVVEQAINDGVDRLFVFEDDAILCKDFAAKATDFLLRLPGNWDGIMLGCQHMAGPMQERPGVVRIESAIRSHAYAVRGGYMRDLYKFWVDGEDIADIGMAQIQKHWHVYAPQPNLIGQREGQSSVGGYWQGESWW